MFFLYFAYFIHICIPSRRVQKPQHGFMVMNRLSTTNLVEPITEKLDFQDQTPFLLYRNGKGKFIGNIFL